MKSGTLVSQDTLMQRWAQMWPYHVLLPILASTTPKMFKFTGKSLRELASNTYDLEKNAFVFHTNNTFVLEKYRGKSKLIGDKDKGNCSLMIPDIKENEPN